MTGRLKIERSSGNVFRDLGFPRAEAKNLILRSFLMSEIREIVRSMTKAKETKHFGITQACLEDLLPRWGPARAASGCGGPVRPHAVRRPASFPIGQTYIANWTDLHSQLDGIPFPIGRCYFPNRTIL